MITGMPHEEYLALPGLSASDIKEIYRSPAHYRERKENPPEQTTAKSFGTAAHMAILEPEKFHESYFALDDVAICESIGGAKPRATTKYKDWKAGIILDNPGKDIIDLEVFQNVEKLAAAVRGHAVAGPLLALPGKPEVVVEWTYPDPVISMKSRLDKLTDTGIILDIKTCQDARPTAFSRDIWNYGYFLQAAVYYQSIIEATGEVCQFVIIAAESSPPFATMVYHLDDSTLELGLSEMDRCINEFDYCTKNDRWPAYREEMRSIAIPAWANMTEVV